MSGVWVPVLASMKGFIAEVNKGAGQAAKSAGSQLEKELGAAGSAGGKSAADGLASAMGAAASKVAAARKREAGAATEVKVAEEQLEQLRKNGEATAGQMMAAEAKVENARKLQQSMADRLGAAEKDLQSVREGGEARVNSLVTAENRVEDARLKVGEATSKAKVAEQQAEDARGASLAATQKAEQAEVQLALAKAEHGEDSKEAAKAERELNTARKESDKSTVAMERAEGRASAARAETKTKTEGLEVAELKLEAAQDKLKASAKGASEEIEDIGTGADSAGGALDGLTGKVGALAGAAAGMAGVGEAFSAGFDVSSEIDKMNRQLGLTGPAAQAAAADVSSALRNGVSGGVDDAVEAVGSLNSQFKYLGFEGEQTAAELADNFTAFASTFGVDMEEATQTAGQLIQNGLATDVEDAADLMTASFQRVPAAMRGELPEIINEYGQNFKNLGFTGEEAFGLLVSASEKGKWALDKSGDALKEFTIRGSDMSKTSVEAYESLGLSAQEMSDKIVKGGPGAQEALKKVADGILGIESPSEQANTAIALFGTQMEDLGVDQVPAFMQALSDGSGGLQDFQGSSQELADQMANSLQGRLNSVKGTAQDLASQGFMKLWDAGEKVASWARDNGTWLGPLVAGLGGMAGIIGGLVAVTKTYTAVTGAWKAMTTLMTGAQKSLTVAMLSSPMTWIVAGIVGVVAALALFFTKTETGKKVWSSFMDTLKGVWAWAKDTFTPMFQSIGDVLSATWEKIKSGWDILWQAMQTAWSSVLKPVFDAIWQVVSTTLGVIGALILSPLLIAWNVLSWGIKAAWENIIKPAWDMLGAAAQWLWTSVLQPVFGWIRTGWDLLAQGLRAAYDSIIKPAWDAVASAGQWLWNSVLMPIFDAIKAGWELLSSGIRAAYDSIIKPAWDALGSALQTLWSSIISPTIGFIKDRWDDLGRGIRMVYDNVISPAFDALKNGLQKVKDFFSTIVDGIRSVWDGLKSALAKPINFMINTVYNGGILKAWNTVAKFIPGLNEASPLAGIPEHATGGAIHGPGSGTSDDVLMWGSNGEHMWTAEEVRKLGGQSAMYTMRSLVDRGETFTVAANGGIFVSGKEKDDNGPLSPVLPAYAKGGEVRPAWEDKLARGHEWARAQNGKPYLAGNQFPAGADCSGFMSALAGVILSDTPTQHWSTVAFPAGQAQSVNAAGQPWVAGLGQGFSIGMSGGPDSGGQNGHTAGTLSAVGNFSAVNVESGGSHGNIAYGGPAAGADNGQFNSQYHLAIGADGDFEAAGGPSPAQKKAFIREKVSGIFDEILDPIKSAIAGAIGSPPPEWLGIPGKALDASKDKTIDFVFDRIEDLGNLIGKTYDNAKKLGSAVFEWGKEKVGGLFRDRGGWIPDGLSIVRNETGRPEAVLNWDQVQSIERLLGGMGRFDPVAEAQAIVRAATEGGSTQEEALRGGTQIAQQVFADEMGNKSPQELGTDALFEFLGMGDSLTKKLVTTSPEELAPVPEWYKKEQSAATGGMTAENIQVTAEVTPESLTAAAAPVPSAATASATDTSQYTSLVQDLDEIDPDRHKTPEWGQDFFVHEIARAAQDKGLPAAGAKIGVATALVEVGEPLRMFASHKVPASLNYRHDAVGDDGTSVGLFQQQDNGAWGTVAQRMDPYESAGLFFGEMLSSFPNWSSMDPGAVAQGVQRSAFPDRYNTKMGTAEQLVLNAGLYDAGGTIPDGALAVNLSGSPEHVFTDTAMEDFVESSADLKQAAADLSASVQTDGPVVAQPMEGAPAIDQGSDTAGQITLVINLDGEQVLEKRVDAVEGRVEVNERDIRGMKTERRAVDAAARVLLA